MKEDVVNCKKDVNLMQGEDSKIFWEEERRVKMQKELVEKMRIQEEYEKGVILYYIELYNLKCYIFLKKAIILLIIHIFLEKRERMVYIL